MSKKGTIGVGVIGLGFMGRTHLAAYNAARRAGHDCRLAAVCDSRSERLAGGADAAGNFETTAVADRLFDASEVHTYTDPARLLADEAVDLVSICTHTDTHVDLAIAALRAGKHVLVEKPVALRAADARRLVDAAAGASTLCMPAMCMRFWPEWVWLKQRIDDRAYGPIRSAVFQRLGGAPPWAQEFYCDVARSGGALVDLHVHDADFVRWCFGEPDAVVSGGSIYHVTTIYQYERGPAHVTAEGGWSHAAGFPFRMRYLVAFERATADFEFGRTPPLLLAHDGKMEPVPMEATSASAYDGEIRHILDAIARGDRRLIAPIEEAEAVTRMLEAERKSLETGGPVRVVS